MNYWVYKDAEKSILIYAGAEFQNPEQGVIVKFTIPSTSTEWPDGIVYLTPLKGGPVRIIEAYDSKIILATAYGMAWAFQVDEELFYDRWLIEEVASQNIELLEPVPYEIIATPELPYINPTPEEAPTSLPTFDPNP